MTPKKITKNSLEITKFIRNSKDQFFVKYQEHLIEKRKVVTLSLIIFLIDLSLIYYSSYKITLNCGIYT